MKKLDRELLSSRKHCMIYSEKYQTQLKSMYLTEIDSIQNEQFFAIQTQEFRKILNKLISQITFNKSKILNHKPKIT